MTDLTLGRYRHYKGNFYEALGTAYHHETLEEMVVYKALYDHPEVGHRPWFVRPKKEFMESVIVNDISVPRFLYSP